MRKISYFSVFYRAVLLTVLLCVLHISATAQTKAQPVEDVVHLQDGSKLRGQIVSYVYGDHLLLAMRNQGDTIRIPQADIASIEQKPISMEASKEQGYRFKEQGFYHALQLSLAGYRDVYNEFMPAGGFSYTFGYKWHRLLATGIGSGYDVYNFELRQEFVPIFAEIRGYLLPSNFTPYYSFSAGYSIPVRNKENASITEQEGGLLLHPALGLRFSGGRSSFTLDAGWRIQKATYINQPWPGAETSFKNEYTFNRFTLRLGVAF